MNAARRSENENVSERTRTYMRTGFHSRDNAWRKINKQKNYLLIPSRSIF